MRPELNTDMRRRFADQVVMVVGAGSGIGQSVAQHSAAEGARLVLADRDTTKAKHTQAMIQQQFPDVPSLVQELDVTKPGDWERAMESVSLEYSQLDVMIQSAGVAADGALTGVTLEQWRRVMAVNLDGAFLGTAAAINAMASRGQGAVVHVSSLAGVRVFAGAAAYGVSKAALIHLTRIAAAECAEAGHRIRVNCVVPGGVKTPIWETTPLWPSIRESEEWKAGPDVPTRKRFAEPDEIARAILFLASHDASYVNGEALMVDGGGGL